MTWNNYSPLANPFTQHNYDLHGFHKDPNAQLPDTTFSYSDYKTFQDNLHVPMQDVPDSMPLVKQGYLNDQFFRCADGTLIDVKNHRILSKKENSDSWTDNVRILDNTRYSKTWNNKDIYDFSSELSKVNGEYSGEIMQQLDVLNKRKTEMYSSLPEIQKTWIQDFENSHCKGHGWTDE